MVPASHPQLLPVGDRAVLVELDTLEEVHRMWAALDTDRPPWVQDVVAGARTILVVAHEGAGDPLALATQLPPPGPAGRGGSRTVTIPVVYDGPDLAMVAGTAGIEPAEVARRHSAPTYTVGFLGFSPGFAYLFGTDPSLAVPRLPSPRTSIPAGSVALAGGMTAVYPQSTPGGWRIIGRTDAVLFDPFRDRPALLSPGDRVRFRPVADLSSVIPPEARPTSPLPGPDSVEVLDAGPLLTVQDGGRPGWAHAGVPLAGAADRRSAALAHHLVGNAPGAALLESTLGGCRLRLRADRAVAVTGARVDITVDGLPARLGVALPLRAGSEIRVGRPVDGVRVYVAFAGGLDTGPVLGSRATDTLSGLGPAPLGSGDVLALGAAPNGGWPTGPAAASRPTRLPGPARLTEVNVGVGPRWDWLSPGGREQIRGATFTVAGSSDRTGVRLDGPIVHLARTDELPSEGMVAGAVQLPPNGRPIVLMRNHPPTGGYPAVAVVDDEGVDALAQAAPGDRVRLSFRP